ncbi:bifunctional diguanylate cyclase/phosphodiesterase [Lichenihabitans sp. Uapishka_5]|uniref:putative bifunctional diguanylate cyclase/phosphodiesterase n=1 Tax=Lichenihabitans sp. Uapishka_5 TaxID=3037302 RepID=UPI0029E7E647|nr:bifunctional diguanylate cyclase/phosphodiesterase [Lichenihabitans sp. Uapishka_5]MDX7953503.1 bifunctional diguanylate cyclase/phosphodiesterase [Lichenihabitans sp. Uapishka_5]
MQAPWPLRRTTIRTFVDLSISTITAGGLSLVLIWLGGTMLQSSQTMRAAAEHALRATELRGQIAFLDQDLTLAARLGAATGDLRWTERFEAAVPTLDATIGEAVSVADPSTRASLVGTIVEANRDLRLMERRALALAGEGRCDGAQALLDGAEFSYLQDVYDAGMEVFGHDLRVGADAHATETNRQLWVRAAAFGFCVMLLVITLMAAATRARLRTAATKDALTQLLNRRQFCTELGAKLDRLPPGGRHALLIIGIDRFKATNDAFGHTAADAMLQGVADRLRRLVPACTPLARVGGDEFAVVVENTGSGALGCEHGLRDLVTTLGTAHALKDGRRIAVTLSAGAAWLTTAATDVDEAMRHAEIALRQAKSDGGDRVRIFDDAMEAGARARVRLEADLRRAIEADEIVPFFQPLVELGSGRVIGAEALARWHHAAHGWVSPAEFIPLTESLGLIDALTERLLRRACLSALAWPEPLTVAFNVSPLQLRDEALPALIRRILADTGFPAHRLELEVTEGAFVSDLDLARRLLEDLRCDGIKLALDDFGTGYSSLKHLRCLPFDTLKIDASFVRGMVDDDESRKIVAAVVGLGHSLGLSTVAEGVETARVAELLRELGCDIGQGWLFGRPVPTADFPFATPAPLRRSLVA